ncbi:hypothetical protein HD597_003964 [Nonomuraea thailandensis]|uniref:Uncharacterized protein n=1 Tax=Nonomuraea thailandensis TaxID=1188745 RepID=A0A9X2GG93_9ACTN|nr:hypothetical protein [Nonomuraea thailandensis]
METSEVAFGRSVEPEAQPAPYLDPVDEPFHCVALLIQIQIMADRTTAAGARLLRLAA